MRHERGGLFAAEEGVDRIAKELECRALLQAAGAQYRPDTFGPTLPMVAACALGQLPVDDDVADGLFGEVVGGLNAGGGDEGEELLGMELEAVAQISDPRAIGCGLELPNEFVAQFLKRETLLLGASR